MAVILVVEDEAITREVAGMCLRDWGHTVLSASSHGEALAILHSSQPIDALFTDVYLRKRVFGGCELAREGRALRPGMRVLYTTGNATTPDLKGRFVDGSRFLGKPYSPHQLHDSVDGVLAA